MVILDAEVGILVLTGIWLVFNYQPSGAFGLSLSGVHYPVIRATHRYVSSLALITSVATAAVLVADAFVRAPQGRRRALLPIGPMLVVTLAAASFTGYILPWDELALWAVTVGSQFKGYRAVFGPNVRFVLQGHSEISQSTLWRWFIIHSVVLTLGVVGLLAAATVLGRRRRVRFSDPGGELPTPTHPD